MAKKKTGAGKKKGAKKKAKAARVGKKAPARKKQAGTKRARSAPAQTRPFFQVDAFTGRLFHGNPAGVVPLEEWIQDEAMQAIAAENNLSETAFVVPSRERAPRGAARLGLRWFTPAVEVDLCGHATLATAHVLWEHAKLKARTLVFDTRSGELRATRDDGMIVLDFPAKNHAKADSSKALAKALGREPVEVYRSDLLMAVYDNKRDIHEMEPDFAAVAALDEFGVIVTAPGAGHDFVSRFFAPRKGIAEDPVTGSAHCMLAPYWAKRLGKNRLTAHQVSRRGGELACEVVGERVRLGGRAVTYLEGKIRI